MDDPRLSRMYAKLFTRDLAKRRRRLWQWMKDHRGSLYLFTFIVALGIFAAGYVAHIHGRFRRLKTELKARSTAPVQVTPMPGGQEAVVLQRTMLAEGTMPEFLSATLLPGRGLNVLQIMLSVPGRGEVALLAAPSLEEAAAEMTGTGADAAGLMSLKLGAPLEAPWGGRMMGSRSEDGRRVATEWHGRGFILPLTGETAGVPVSDGGLLLKTAAETVGHNVMPDGGSLQGQFTAGSFGGVWASQTNVAVTALLSSRAFELKLVARNDGKEPVPMGLGWYPRIIMPSGGRAGVKLRLPAETREEFGNGRASGRLLPVSGSAFDFTDRAGKPLRELAVDETFTGLRAGFLDNGPIVELRDEQSGVGFRMTAMSPQIRAIRVQSAPDRAWVGLGFQTNYDDPFSRAWGRESEAAIHVLQPGQSLQWKVRLEVFPLRDGDKPML